MKLSENEYLEHVASDDGYCTTCNSFIEGDFFEPDCQDRRCHNCGENTAMGVELALVCDHITIVGGD